ncbi:MAG TPA: elongation factor G [Myxococcota bacterium]|nr:elongation factor G [Myxococcota bacterium]
MKKYEASDIRNLAFVGHKGSGKTSLAEACLFDGKTTTRLGGVDGKTSTFDFEQEEMDRGMTIATSVGVVEWKKHKLNIIDTPGDGNFIFDTRFSMAAADAAIVVVSAPDGVEVQTERVWERASDLGIPRVIYVNKMDRERADPDKVVAEIRARLSNDAIPVQLPIGREADFKGVLDVLASKAYLFEKDSSGGMKTVDVPDDLKATLATAKEALTEKIAESDDGLLEKYLEAGELSVEETAKGFAKAVREGLLFPVFFGSATHNVGIQPLMDFSVQSLPAPNELPPLTGHVPGDGEAERARSEDQPFWAFVFKTIDAQGGNLSLFRILSGSITGDTVVQNVDTDSEERIGSLLVVCGKKQEQASAASTGDIVGVLKLKKTATGNSLCDKKSPLLFPGIELPPPAISYAVKPKSKADEDKLGTCLNRLLAEDPTLRVSRHEDTQDFMLSGMGSQHVEIAVGKMKRRFGVDVILETPKVPYRETITKKAEARGKHKRQTGGRGQYGDVWLELSPQPRGGGFEFENRIKGGVVPGQFIPAVEKGVVETMSKGVLAGFPVVDIKVALYDGSYHDVDSSEMAFKRAASKGFKAAMENARPVMLEPVYNMEVAVPDENMGDIIGDLNSRRGRVQGMDTKGKRSIIKAQVPLAEILRYSPDLDSRTGGRGSFTMEFSHYQEVPQQLVDKIVAANKPGDEEEDKN